MLLDVLRQDVIVTHVDLVIEADGVSIFLGNVLISVFGKSLPVVPH